MKTFPPDWPSEVNVPDGVTPITSARCFMVANYGGGLTRLMSINSQYGEWSPGPNVAVCGPTGRKAWTPSNGPASGGMWIMGGSGLSPHHPNPPEPNCGCGFWGLTNPLDLPGYYGLFGLIEQWGKVVCGTKGWRSQYAKLVGVVLADAIGPDRNERSVATLYEVPLLDEWPELTAPMSKEEGWTSERSNARSPSNPSASPTSSQPRSRERSLLESRSRSQREAQKIKFENIKFEDWKKGK